LDLAGNSIFVAGAGSACDEITAAVDDSLTRIGRLHILVNSIGGTVHDDRVSLNAQTWNGQTDLTLNSLFLH
jgi:hypothetical protein